MSLKAHSQQRQAQHELCWQLTATLLGALSLTQCSCHHFRGLMSSRCQLRRTRAVGGCSVSAPGGTQQHTNPDTFEEAQAVSSTQEATKETILQSSSQHPSRRTSSHVPAAEVPHMLLPVNVLQAGPAAKMCRLHCCFRMLVQT